MKTYDDIMATLPNLNPAELRKVVGMCNLLLSSAVGKDNVEEDEQLVHEAIQRALKERGGKCGPLRNLPWYDKFSKVVPVFIMYVEQQARPTNRTERTAYVGRLIDMCVHYLREHNVAVSHKTITDCLPKADEVTDFCFPGYQQSGLLSWVFKGTSI